MSGGWKSADNGATYISYLLRLWRVAAGGQVTWRASLEDPHTGERLGFAGFDELLSYLEERTRVGSSLQTDTGKNGLQA
jgi:hypothetical protein